MTASASQSDASDSAVFRPFEIPRLPAIPDRTFDIREYGALPDGLTLNTQAIAAAIATADSTGGGRVVIPAGVWLTGPIHFKDRIELHLEEGAELRFSQNPDDYLPVVFTQRGGAWCHNYSPFIYGRDCQDVALTGKGTLNGQGESWWPWKKKQPGMLRLREMVAERVPFADRVFGTVEAGVRPCFLQFLDCRNVLLDGITFIDSPSWTLNPVQCVNLTIRGVTVRNPARAPNTDGIDPSACRDVLIEHCHVDTGDDGICLKSGWNEDAWEASIPCENVVVRHCTVLAAHGGFVIGSAVSGGIRSVHVHDCVFDGTDVGVRIKTKPGRGGYIRDILAERLTMRAIGHEAILITQLYNGNPHDRSPIDPSLPVTEISDICISDVDCDQADTAIRLHGLPGHPLGNIGLDRLRIRARQGLDIRDVANLHGGDWNISHADEKK